MNITILVNSIGECLVLTRFESYLFEKHRLYLPELAKAHEIAYESNGGSEMYDIIELFTKYILENTNKEIK